MNWVAMGQMAAAIGVSLALAWVMVKLTDLGVHPWWVLAGLLALAILAAGLTK